MGKETQQVLAEIFRGHRVEKIFREILHISASNNFSVAFWRNPFDNEFNCLITFKNSADWRVPEIESLDPGFLFSPFENNDNKRVLYLGKDLHIKWKQEDAWQVRRSQRIELSPVIDFFFQKLTEALKSPESKVPAYWLDSVHEKDTGKKNYIDIIRKSIKAIHAGRFIKVVPSRFKSVRLHKKVNPVHVFSTVAKAYPNSFISLISTPFTGTWLGASPEILISIHNNEIFQTSSIAGTKSYKPRTRLADVSWTQKEIEEQAIVTRYIINCFKKIRLREFEELGPKTVLAGNLLHLKTLLIVNMKETNFPQLGSVMLKLLHPTSAICGMPLEEAKTFLNKAENYNRKYYSGYLGPVNVENKTEIYVNIRCANILQDKVVFYAGAGVTGHSVPLKEWRETEVKIQSISRFFR